MNYVGEFREGEINGKPFHIFNFLSQTVDPSSSSSSGEATIDSGGDDLPPPLFICQSFRSIVQWFIRRSDDPNRDEYLPVDVYPHFFDKRRGYEQFQYMIGSEIYNHPCKLPLVPLFWCNNKKPYYKEFRCGLCRRPELGTDYYCCVDRCGEKFHKECIECPLEIKHPSFPFSSLKLYYPPYPQVNDFSSLNCLCCQTEIKEMLYYCPTYKLILHPICAMKPISILIDHPKRHPHPLTFFPKQNSLPCDVCGLIKQHFPTYVCPRCVFVVHQNCVYNPYVIRISRHHHRISFTYSLPSGKWSCGVCRRSIENNYGAYSCKECDDYFVHTKCALRRDLWDGKELEGIPEEPEIVRPWCHLGCLHDFLGERGCIELCILRSAKLWDVLSCSRQRNHRSSLLNKVEAEIRRRDRSLTEDESPLWRRAMVHMRQNSFLKKHGFSHVMQVP